MNSIWTAYYTRQVDEECKVSSYGTTMKERLERISWDFNRLWKATKLEVKFPPLSRGN